MFDPDLSSLHSALSNGTLSPLLSIKMEDKRHCNTPPLCPPPPPPHRSARSKGFRSVLGSSRASRAIPSHPEPSRAIPSHLEPSRAISSHLEPSPPLSSLLVGSGYHPKALKTPSQTATAGTQVSRDDQTPRLHIHAVTCGGKGACRFRFRAPRNPQSRSASTASGEVDTSGSLLDFGRK